MKYAEVTVKAENADKIYFNDAYL